jgi:tetrapyrrole methylase family protein / MazG family protein
MDYLKRLENLMTRLRSKKGCPWDKRQTHKSLKPYLLEETHETLDAIDSGSPDSLREELGDVLLQVVFHSQLAKEKGRFNLQDVAKTIGDKLVRRHPHVFGKGASRKIADINRKWEELKRQEKPERKSALDGLPKSLPALLRAQRMHEKISKHDKASRDKRQEKELEKLWKKFQRSLTGGNKKSKDKSAGEFLLAFAQLSQSTGIHAEMVLTEASSKFEKRFRKLESNPKN